jgi:carboxylate-amine ligase
VRRLLAELEEDLRDHDEWPVVVELVERLFEHGTSAARQRRTWQRTGDRREVAARIVREGTALENR